MARTTTMRAPSRRDDRRDGEGSAAQVRHAAAGRVSACFSGMAMAIAAALAAAPAAADDIVYLEGISTSTELSAGQAAVSRMDFASRGDFCAFDNPALQAASDLDEALNQVREQLGSVDPGLSEQFDNESPPSATDRTLDAVREACATPAETRQVVKIVYSTCRMTMRDGTHMIDVRFPPGTGGGWLTFLDPATFEATELPVEFTAVMNEDSGVAQGTNSGDFKRGDATENRRVQVNHESVSIVGRHHTFDFNFRLNIMRSLMGVAGLGATMSAEGAASGGAGASAPSAAEVAQMEQFFRMMPSPNIHSNGSALIAPDVPGLGIIRDFYQTFAAAMGAEGSYLSGLLNHKLLEAGFPLQLEQTTELILDSGGFFGMGMPGIGGQQSKSTMQITRIVGPLTTSYAYCQDSIVPPDYTVTNPVSGMSSGSDAGAAPGANGAEAAAAMNDAMNQMNAAMANMSDEERAAMEQFAGGFGQLLGGALSGQAPAGPAASGSAAAAAPTAARASSSELMTGDVTQSVQNMLQALGYDPGSTDGELQTQTVIAISQFQAEQGLEVTGEVTPQLLGILAAEVDGR